MSFCCWFSVANIFLNLKHCDGNHIYQKDKTHYGIGSGKNETKELKYFLTECLLISV